MAAPAVKVEVEFAPPTWTDISAYVRLTNPITMTFGRSDTDERVPPGRLSGLTLRNTDGRFTVGNAAGAYYPNVTSGKRVRVSVQDPVTSGWVVRWTGYIDGWPMWWEAGRALVTVSATDALSKLLDPVDTGWWLEYAHTGAELYWPMTDYRDDRNHASGATDGTPYMIAPVPAVSPPPTDPGPAGDPSPLPVTQAVDYVAWEVPVVYAGSPLSGTAHLSWSASCLFKSSTPVAGTPLWARAQDYSYAVGLQTTAEGYLRVGLLTSATWVGFYGSDTVNICDGQWWWLGVGGSIEDDDLAGAWAYRIDGSASTFASVSEITDAQAMFTGQIAVRVGEYPATIGHVSWGYDAWNYTAGNPLPDAFLGLPYQSTYDFGILFNGGMGSFPVAVLDSSRSVMHSRPMPATMSDLWAQVEAVDGGVTHAMPDGTLRYLGGGYRTLPLGGSATPALALDATTVASLRVEMDRLKLVNDVTVTTKRTSTGGDAIVDKVTSTDAGSITASGRHAKTHEAYGTRYSGGAATIAAELLSPTETPRIPEVEVDALTLPAATQHTILAGGYSGGPVNMWDLLSVTDMPTQGAFPDWLGRIEGWTETLGATVWTIKFNTTYSGAVTPTALYPATDLYPSTSLYPAA